MKQNTTYPRVLGQVLRSHRELRGVTLEAMAEAMGCHQSSWSRVETGTTTASITQLRRAAGYLGRELWALVKDADGMAATLEKRGIPVCDHRLSTR